MGFTGQVPFKLYFESKENFKCKDNRYLGIFGMNANAKVEGRRDMAVLTIVILWFGEVMLLWPWQ